MARKRRVVVEQDPDAPIEKAVLAAHIIEISRSIAKIQKLSRLNRRAIVLLIHDGIPSSRRPPKWQIEAVLESIEELERNFCQ